MLFSQSSDRGAKCQCFEITVGVVKLCQLAGEAGFDPIPSLAADGTIETISQVNSTVFSRW